MELVGGMKGGQATTKKAGMPERHRPGQVCMLLLEEEKEGEKEGRAGRYEEEGVGSVRQSMSCGSSAKPRKHACPPVLSKSVPSSHKQNHHTKQNTKNMKSLFVMESLYLDHACPQRKNVPES